MEIKFRSGLNYPNKFRKQIGKVNIYLSIDILYLSIYTYLNTYQIEYR